MTKCFIREGKMRATHAVIYPFNQCQIFYAYRIFRYNRAANINPPWLGKPRGSHAAHAFKTVIVIWIIKTFEISSVSITVFFHIKNTNLSPAKGFIDLPHQVLLPSLDSVFALIAPSLVPQVITPWHQCRRDSCLLSQNKNMFGLKDKTEEQTANLYSKE